MLGDRVEVDHTGCEHDREIRVREAPRQPAKATDAALFVRPCQEGEPEIFLGESPRGAERQAVA